MSIFEAFILGLVQGLTEFLPVSSSGHLQIAKELLGVEITDNIAFDVTLHFATVLSTIVVLWSAVKRLFAGFFSFRKGPDMTYALKIIVSMVPVGVVGFLLKDKFNEMLASDYIMLVVGAMLLITAALLTFAQRAKPRNKEVISWGDAAVIGTAQAVATMPGLSRSGTTIATGLILGNKRAVVAEFSFLMSAPPIAGAAILELAKSLRCADAGGAQVSWLLCGFGAVLAAVVGWFALKLLVASLKGRWFWLFGPYCIVAGLLTVAIC